MSRHPEDTTDPSIKGEILAAAVVTGPFLAFAALSLLGSRDE